MLISGMTFPLKYCRFMVIAAAASAACGPGALGQQPAAASSPILDRLKAMTEGGKSAWSEEQLRTMERLRDEAMKSDYAYEELRHLTDNIGPRLSGSPQAQKAVEWVADEMRALGAQVRLEKASVPHWTRGLETGE
jgi:hypothetical protein